jgi:hypothetical protein
MGDVSVSLTRLKGLIHMDASITSQDTELTNYWNDARRFYDNKLAVHTTLPALDTGYDDDAPDLIARLAAAWWNSFKTPNDATMKMVSHMKTEILDHLMARFSKRTDKTSGRAMTKTVSAITGFE